MMEPIRYREHSFRPDNDPVWRKRGLKTFLPRRLLAALKGDQTTSEIAARFQIHPTMVSTWKRELLENAPDLFEGKKRSGKQSNEPSSDELYREIGRLTVERDFLSRKLDQ